MAAVAALARTLRDALRFAAVASRKEQKERLRQERLAKEEASRHADARARLRRNALVGVLGVAAIAGVVIAVASGGGGNSGDKPASAGKVPAVAIPAVKETNLTAAASAAGCALRTFPDFGSQHTTSPVTYKTNPPTSGPHYPVPASDGLYDSGSTPPTGRLVHAMEHGRVEIQYRPGTPKRTIGQLETLFNEPAGGQGPGYLTLLFENRTGMRYAVAASAWTHLLACRRLTSRTFDALRAFRKAYLLKGPEVIPQPE